MTLDLPKIEKVAPLPPGLVDPPKEPVIPAKTVTPRSVWIMGGVTVGAGVLTGVMGGLALSALGSLNEALATFPGEATTLADVQSRTRTFALVTEIVRLGSIEAIRRRALEGAGVAVLPAYQIEADLKRRAFVRVFPKVAPLHDYFRLVFRADDVKRPIYGKIAAQLQSSPLR